VWDDWNKKHLSIHNVTIEEVEEVCHGKYKVTKSFRKRIMLVGKTKSGRRLAVVLSPEDRNLNIYKEEGTYYLITSYEKEV
ncbi:hypothetical protein COY62_03305, partial [bacterium (Candidatus Howlettbacteria) CG_4_10_14_0_8_um_filter_40_9]